MAVLVNSRGYWENNTTEGHGVDKGLARGLLKFFELQSLILDRQIFVIDVGCGTGFYTNYINDNTDRVICHGYDGNPNTPFLAGINCGVFDFTREDAYILRKHDWVLSLEVGEHIPPQYEDIFINNLHILNTEGIVLSWSIPEYGGDGHVNPKSNSYVLDRITKLGYSFLEKSTQVLKEQVAKYPHPCYWFRDTLMIFDKERL